MNLDFTAFMSHLPMDQLTPQSCIDSCQNMRYSMAAIKNGLYCFCSKTNVVTPVDEIMPVASCSFIICSGDSNYYCGAGQRTLVYKTVAGFTVSFKIFQFKIKRFKFKMKIS
jgi:hypothetical protein